MFYRFFFLDPAPPEVVDRYVSANFHCFGDSVADPAADAVVRHRLDPEAVELVMRSHGSSLLTRKIQILFYLAEVRADHYPHFAASGESLSGAILCMSVSVFRSGWKFVKGQYLVRRYRLV